MTEEDVVKAIFKYNKYKLNNAEQASLLSITNMGTFPILSQGCETGHTALKSSKTLPILIKLFKVRYCKFECQIERYTF